jgi:hypothetical protein
MIACDSQSNALARAELDNAVASERLQDDIGACPYCVHDFTEKCPVVGVSALIHRVFFS